MWCFICDDMLKMKEAILASNALDSEKKMAEEIYNAFDKFHEANKDKSCYTLCEWWKGDSREVKRIRRTAGRFVTESGKTFFDGVNRAMTYGPYVYTDD